MCVCACVRACVCACVRVPKSGHQLIKDWVRERTAYTGTEPFVYMNKKPGRGVQGPCHVMRQEWDSDRVIDIKYIYLVLQWCVGLLLEDVARLPLWRSRRYISQIMSTESSNHATPTAFSDKTQTDRGTAGPCLWVVRLVICHCLGPRAFCLGGGEKCR